MTLRAVLLASLSISALASCADEGGADGPPAAPSGLTAEPLGGGAHLTWTDNSDNEVHFMVMRMEDGVDTEYQQIAMTTFDTAQYHDTDVTAGGTYMYKITAMNEAGESDSNEVTFDAP